MNSFKEILKKLNDLGIPLPLVRDPKTNKGSFTATLLVISSIYWGIGYIGNAFNLGSFSLNEAYWFVALCLGTYVGNKAITKKGAQSSDTNGDVDGQV